MSTYWLCSQRAPAFLPLNSSLLVRCFRHSLFQPGLRLTRCSPSLSWYFSTTTPAPFLSLAWPLIRNDPDFLCRLRLGLRGARSSPCPAYTSGVNWSDLDPFVRFSSVASTYDLGGRCCSLRSAGNDGSGLSGTGWAMISQMLPMVAPRKKWRSDGSKSYKAHCR